MKIYLLIKYIKSVLRIVAKRLSYIEEARCLKVKEACSAFLLTDGVKHECFMPFFCQFRLEKVKLLSKDVYIYCVVLV